jgi:PhnB protein
MPEPAFPTITPYLLYEDVPAALQLLSNAFGFKERLRFTADDGTVNHAEMELGDGVFMMGDPGPQYRGPRRGSAA